MGLQRYLSAFACVVCNRFRVEGWGCRVSGVKVYDSTAPYLSSCTVGLTVGCKMTLQMLLLEKETLKHRAIGLQKRRNTRIKRHSASESRTATVSDTAYFCRPKLADSACCSSQSRYLQSLQPKSSQCSVVSLGADKIFV